MKRRFRIKEQPLEEANRLAAQALGIAYRYKWDMKLQATELELLLLLRQLRLTLHCGVEGVAEVECELRRRQYEEDDV